MFRKRLILEGADDATLVMHSLGGNRDAFCEIVTRYQNLLCSLAYSSVGDIKQSEDIAQDAFIDAWTQLDTLRDPQKLKAWLCGILRFKVSHHRRKTHQHLSDNDPSLADSTLDSSSADEMDEQAIKQQQEKLMWQVLEGMEATYREPLILFYREQQSIERVAAELDLSPDTAKQRLSRGRKLLKAAMSTFVEESLTRSKPGVAFTAAVLTAISSVAPPAKAAAYGAGVAKAGSFFTYSALLTLLATFSGLISTFLGLQAGLAQTRTANERKLVIKVVSVFIAWALFYVIGLIGLRQFAVASENYTLIYTLLSQLLVAAFVLVYIRLVSQMVKAMKTLRVQERLFNPQAFKDDAARPDAKQREYISTWRLFGVPLFHFQFGMPEKADKAAYGWIAGGSYAYGLLFAWGGFAVAPISVGIVSIGVVTVGAVGFGLLSLGTVAIGLIGFGASAVAYKAYASLSSLGWESAFSQGFSIAKNAAIGPVAYAQHVNNETAATIVQLSFFDAHYKWLLATIAVLVIVPAAWHSHTVRKRMKLSKTQH
ncbi:sigma-70 family RNA polymerase sigma factor [Alteromonas sp. D210916BOD_24]|uniref:RNA polymerase sigma factor n=1 Tax=Alteromonas sp. D210916BOD_24 TaxID=3157618 RepID=UPI00399CAE05